MLCPRCPPQFALYYHLPTLSVKACCQHLLQDSTRPGFWTNVSRNEGMDKLKDVCVPMGAVAGYAWIKSLTLSPCPATAVGLFP